MPDFVECRWFQSHRHFCHSANNIRTGNNFCWGVDVNESRIFGSLKMLIVLTRCYLTGIHREIWLRKVEFLRKNSQSKTFENWEVPLSLILRNFKEEILEQNWFFQEAPRIPSAINWFSRCRRSRLQRMCSFHISAPQTLRCSVTCAVFTQDVLDGNSISAKM